MKTDILYNNIGEDYSNFRKPDPSLIHFLAKHLSIQKGTRVLDIGAGTGKYACAIAEMGCNVVGLEPSDVMLKQCNENVCPMVRGVCERLPFKANSFQKVICVLAIHHFAKIKKALKEMNRICSSGKIIILLHDVALFEPSWFQYYFEELFKRNIHNRPSLSQIKRERKLFASESVKIIPYVIPQDFKDIFFGAGFSDPEIYLNPSFRKSSSTFALAPPDMVQDCLSKLEFDLSNGIFDQKFGEFRTRSYLDIGLRLIIFNNQEKAKETRIGCAI